ncbi:hypothetical protein LIA77_07302 [Sarocladium implicatum]|nr:hypothetical protein LIA77_07302 [Sarocladium implicatum]
MSDFPNNLFRREGVLIEPESPLFVTWNGGDQGSLSSRDHTSSMQPRQAGPGGVPARRVFKQPKALAIAACRMVDMHAVRSVWGP